MERRDFIKLAALGALQTNDVSSLLGSPLSEADVTLRIGPVTVELTPKLVFSTIGYNGTSPGPVLRMREGVPQIVDVVNDTDVPEQVHWHGLLLPAELDGADEQGTPPVPPHGRRRYG